MGYHFLLQEIFPSQDRTQASRVSCMDRRILYHWAPWEAQAEMGNYYFWQQWRLRLQKYPAARWCKFIPRGGSRIQPGLAFTSGTRIFSSAEAWNLKKYKAKCEAYTISKIVCLLGQSWPSPNLHVRSWKCWSNGMSLGPWRGISSPEMKETCEWARGDRCQCWEFVVLLLIFHRGI